MTVRICKACREPMSRTHILREEKQVRLVRRQLPRNCGDRLKVGSRVCCHHFKDHGHDDQDGLVEKLYPLEKWIATPEEYVVRSNPPSSSRRMQTRVAVGLGEPSSSFDIFEPDCEASSSNHSSLDHSPLLEQRISTISSPAAGSVENTPSIKRARTMAWKKLGILFRSTNTYSGTWQNLAKIIKNTAKHMRKAAIAFESIRWPDIDRLREVSANTKDLEPGRLHCPLSNHRCGVLLGSCGYITRNIMLSDGSWLQWETGKLCS